MLKKLFGEPAITGLESDAYWLGLFLGFFTSFFLLTVLLFLVLPADLAGELTPALIVVALLVSYPLMRGFQRLLAWLVGEYRVRWRPTRVAAVDDRDVDRDDEDRRGR